MEQSFTDYYEHLQISQNADLETIERVFRYLAKRYHTDNRKTGNIDKFNLITTAYRILSDPEKRAAYDVVYEESKHQQWQAVTKAFHGEGFESDRHIRRTILSILYVKRREKPSEAGVGIVQLENMMEWPGEALDFHIWYLREKELIKRTETGGFEITAKGVDKIETDGLVLNNERLLSDASKSVEEDPIYLIGG